MSRGHTPIVVSESPQNDHVDLTEADEAPPTARPRRLSRRRIVGALAVLVMIVPGVSYVRALTYPGSASVQVRSVEWIRDHGGNPLVDTLENWWYTLHAPSASAPDPAALPLARGSLGTQGTDAAARARAFGGPSALPPLAGGHSAVDGEGLWVPGRLDPSGAPSIYTTFVRPDPGHPSVVAGVAWVRGSDTAAHLVAGTVEPGGSRWPGGARVAPEDVPSLVATFNSGWKMSGARGGFYVAGRTHGALRDGQASFVIDDTGGVTVGRWGRDVQMSSHVVAVRQNLALIVDNGLPAAGLTANQGQRWGNSKNQFQYTWRSAVGVDSAGALIYVGGVNLTLKALTTALVDAHVVRGMELDIHSAMVSFASWSPSPGGAVAPTKLLPNMSPPADRYLAADQRDFFYLTLR